MNTLCAKRSTLVSHIMSALREYSPCVERSIGYYHDNGIVALNSDRLARVQSIPCNYTIVGLVAVPVYTAR